MKRVSGEAPASSSSCCPLHNSFIPWRLLPISSSHFGTSKDKRRSCFPFLPQPLFAAEYPLKYVHLPVQPLQGGAGVGTGGGDDNRSVAVPTHARLQFHTCGTMVTWLCFCGRGCCTCGKHPASWATGHLCPCLAPTGFQQPL